MLLNYVGAAYIMVRSIVWKIQSKAHISVVQEMKLNIFFSVMYLRNQIPYGINKELIS